MRILERYSHLNGWEYLQVHKPKLWREVERSIADVEAERYQKKISEERRRLGDRPYDPKRLNFAFQREFNKWEWAEHRHAFYVTADQKLMRTVHSLQSDDQRRCVEATGQTPIKTYNQANLVKDRVAVEVQLSNYAFVAHDLFVKHLSLYVSDVIDVGIEILPMKEMEREMPLGVPYYERDLVNVIRQGRGVPAVPLVLIGIAP